MRARDHNDTQKHLKSIGKIAPVCQGSLVMSPLDSEQTMRYLIEWQGRTIKTALVIGGLVDGEPMVSEVGTMCIAQWTRSYPHSAIVFAEFKHVATGNRERLRARFIDCLEKFVANQQETSILVLAAKNSTMYDKISAFIELRPQANS